MNQLLIICIVIILLPTTLSFQISKLLKNSIITCLTPIISFHVINSNALNDNIINKQMNLPSNEIVKIVANDITNNQALITADFTRSIYSEDCIFQDEIDKYKLPDYIKGTKALFDETKSHVDLIDNPLEINNIISFKFKEKLTFRLPFEFRPYVYLSGRVELTRDLNNGLVVYSREYWDESVLKVLKSIHIK